MDSDGGEFLLSSPSYRIEKARLRYENLLLSLDDDSVDDAERHMNTELSIGVEDNFLENPYDEETYDSFHTSRLENKQGSNVSRHSSQLPKPLAPITDIYKSVTRRYVLDSTGSVNNALKSSSSSDIHCAMDKGSSSEKQIIHEMQHGKQETKQSSHIVAIHENDDIIIAQQSEIEMLKYELNALKMASAKESHALKESQHHLQTALDTERDASSRELAACKSDLQELKNLYNKTKDEHDVDKTKLKQALRHLDRITRRDKALHSVEDGTFSCFKKNHRHPHPHHIKNITA